MRIGALFIFMASQIGPLLFGLSLCGISNYSLDSEQRKAMLHLMGFLEALCHTNTNYGNESL